MKAIQVREHGGPEKLIYGDYPKPQIGPDDILIDNAYAGLNFIDIYFRKGIYEMPLPYTPGMEGSGTVVAKGESVSDIKIGDRVGYVAGGSGSYAQYTQLAADKAVLLPEGIDFKIAAAALLQGLTANYLTHLTYVLQKGQTTLIHAGAGGVGLLLIQMAKAIGVEIITTVSTEEKAQLVKKFGANHVILYKDQDFVAITKKITQNQGVNVVYDAVGRDTFNGSLQCLTRRGMLVSYGQSSGVIPPFSPLQLAGSTYLTRPSLFDYVATKKELRDQAANLFNYILQKKLHFHIGKEYLLADADAAQRDLEQRLTTGKVLLKIEE